MDQRPRAGAVRPDGDRRRRGSRCREAERTGPRAAAAEEEAVTRSERCAGGATEGPPRRRGRGSGRGVVPGGAVDVVRRARAGVRGRRPRGARGDSGGGRDHDGRGRKELLEASRHRHVEAPRSAGRW